MDETEDSICVGCGLCCDGTLHGSTTVRDDDEARVLRAGLQIVEQGHKRLFRQPCPHFSCGKCSIYAGRPGVCQTYRCALLIRLEAGEVTEDAAREKIEEAKMLAQTVKLIDSGAVTPARRTALVDRLKQKLRQLHGSEREETAKMLLDIGILEHFLGRWFLKDKKKDAKAEARVANARVLDD